MSVSYYIYPGLRYSNYNTTQKRRMKQGRDNEDHLKILAAVCKFYGVEEMHVRSKCRKRKYVWCRHVYYFLCSRLTTMTLEQIGEELKTDHTTVIHGKATVQNILETESTRIKEIDEIEGMIHNVKTIGG